MRVAAALARGGAGGVGGTLSSVIADPHQAKAAYRLLDRAAVTHEAVLAPHAARTLQATAPAGDYLLIEDTTALDYHGLRGCRGLGPIGEDFTRGLWVHTTLAVRVDWDQDRRELLGVLGQKVWARPARRPARAKSRGPGKEHNHARHLREERESARWMAGLEAAGGPLPGTTWTYVADRESDIYELFQSAWAGGWSHVIRATHRRALAGAWAGQDLFTAAAAGETRGRVEVEVPRQKRGALLEVRSATLELRGPRRPGGRLEDHTLTVVHAAESDPPSGVAPLRWVLLTDLPAATPEECRRVIAVYRQRWLIEEFHKALKTGLRVEASQLSDARRLSALVGVLSVVAVFLLGLKLETRGDPEAELAPGDADAPMLAVLRKLDPPRGPPTRRWFWHAIAKLGGFMGRKGDGDPGWLTLWRGWQTLMLLTRGYELANTS